MTALLAGQLGERRRSLLWWGVPLGLWSAFVVAIYPSIEAALTKAVRNYPQALKEAFGIGTLTTVEQYLHAEMLSLIVPLVVGYLAVRSIASGLSGAAESGRLDVVLSAPVSRMAAGRRRLRRDRDRARAGPRLRACPRHDREPALGRRAAVRPGARRLRRTVWPLGLMFAGLGIVVTGWSLRTSVVTGAVAGVLVAMYVIDSLAGSTRASTGSATSPCSATTATP